MMATIELSKKAMKQYKKLPHFIQDSFEYWVQSVAKMGVLEVRKIKGFHDEALRGIRKGQRSVRLSKSYRVMYTAASKYMFWKSISINTEVLWMRSNF